MQQYVQFFYECQQPLWEAYLESGKLDQPGCDEELQATVDSVCSSFP